MIIDNNVPMQASCVARHIGLWMVETTWFAGAVAAAKAGAFQVQRVEPNQEALYTSDQGGIASIAMIGPMMKGPSKFGGTDTVRTREHPVAYARPGWYRNDGYGGGLLGSRFNGRYQGTRYLHRLAQGGSS